MIHPHRLSLGFGLLLACACSSFAATPASSPQSVLIRGVPHVEQKPDFCGEACAAMALSHFLGRPVSQDRVFDAAGLDPAEGRGLHTPELVRALQKLGFETGTVWHTVRPGRPADLQRLFRAMHADLRAGIPSIICTRYDARPKTTEHFRLVLGYDARDDSVIYHEPAMAGGARRRMSRARLFDLWPLKYRRDRWTVIRIRLQPRGLRLPPRPATRFSPADYAQHVQRLKRRVPRGFTVVIAAPFVVIGDEDPGMVRIRARRTVGWAVEKLKAAYFNKDPDRILDIWLFRDARSYRRHTLQLFGERPDTPYGFYSRHHRALVMNIGTGGGTLVHEIVHPFVEANFPACPAWFNEGLGSLYEQSAERSGQIHGLTNWRLAGLQAAIQAGAVPSFARLTAQTTNQFYGADPGTNYAQARYLLYYLQQRGLLRRYYHAFVRNQRSDPSGYRTLKQVLGERDMAAFQRRWSRYVLGLRYP
jgi:hypothetical protein